MNQKYFKPRSLTWWAGVALVLMGGLVGMAEAVNLGGWDRAINAWTGNLPPAALIAQGAGLIGLRGAFAR